MGKWIALSLLGVGLAVAAAWAGGSSPRSGGGTGLDDYPLGASMRRYALHERVRELSGLALSHDGRLFGHDDERAMIYEIGSEGQLRKAFGFGTPVVEGDFEGIAIAGDRFYLVTSRGVVYEGGEGKDGDRLPFESTEVDVGKKCDVEGLAYEEATDALLLACKEPKGKKKKKKARVRIHRWSLKERAAHPTSPLEIPLASLDAGGKSNSFHPSGIEVHPESGHYFLVSARAIAIAEVTPEGEVVSVRRLVKGVHKRVEGITFATSLAIVLADEGGRGQAQVTVYPR
jgi:uncharacterized protein YjiK